MSLKLNLSGHGLGIAGVNSQIYSLFNPFAALSELVASEVAYADDRSGLGHTVTGDERQAELLDKQLLEMLGDGCSSCCEHFDISAKSLVEDDSQGVAEVRIILVVLELGGSALAVDELSEGVFDELCQHQRHGEEELGLVLPQSRFEVARDRRQSKHYEVHSVAQRGNHIDGHSEDVGKRKNGDGASASLERKVVGQ